jgi:hypothetical protein
MNGDSNSETRAKPPSGTAEPTHPVPEHFVDGVANIALSNGVVRIDFAHLSATAREAHGEPPLERNVRLITSVEGFVATYRTMQRMVDRLAKQGKLAVVPGAAPHRNPET